MCIQMHIKIYEDVKSNILLRMKYKNELVFFNIDFNAINTHWW